jgi:hypothetical protein
MIALRPKLYPDGNRKLNLWAATSKRLLVCETLKEEAPGIEYNASLIANLRVIDPWRADPNYVVPPVVLVLVKIKQQAGPVIEAWAA